MVRAATGCEDDTMVREALEDAHYQVGSVALALALTAVMVGGCHTCSQRRTAGVVALTVMVVSFRDRSHADGATTPAPALTLTVRSVRCGLCGLTLSLSLSLSLSVSCHTIRLTSPWQRSRR